MKKLYLNIATMGPIGYLPAPGTFGTLFSIPIVYALSFLSMRYCLLISLFIFVLLFLAVRNVIKYKIYDNALKDRKDQADHIDPREIVVDELVGILVTFYAINLNVISIFIGFLLFRFFDITKPLFIKKLERVPGAWGIFLDDIAAGFISNLILLLISFYAKVF